MNNQATHEQVSRIASFAWSHSDGRVQLDLRDVIERRLLSDLGQTSVHVPRVFDNDDEKAKLSTAYQPRTYAPIRAITVDCALSAPGRNWSHPRMVWNSWSSAVEALVIGRQRRAGHH